MPKPLRRLPGVESPFVLRAELLSLVPLSMSTIDRLEAEGKFPGRIRLEPTNRVAWLRREVTGYLRHLGRRRQSAPQEDHVEPARRTARVALGELFRMFENLRYLQPAQLIGFVRSIDWASIDYATRLVVVHELNTAITAFREARGLPPIDDGLPGTDTPFRTIPRASRWKPAATAPHQQFLNFCPAYRDGRLPSFQLRRRRSVGGQP